MVMCLNVRPMEFSINYVTRPQGYKTLQPIIALYFEFENELKFYNVGASTLLVTDNSLSVISGRRRKAVENIA